MRVAFVGCGYVADFYAQTLGNHPGLELAGVMDRNPERSARFAAHYGVPQFGSLEELLADGSIGLVANLTNPRSHYAVSRAALEAGKHVYSEKPLATDLGEARALVELAHARGLRIAAAPCNVLGESAQTAWKAIRNGAVGPVRLVYAELDDGLVHRMRYSGWISPSGAPWPFRDEFEVGCTLEHAGYYLTWLTAFFGPVRAVTAFASCQVPDKQVDPPLASATPDFTVACLEFADGVVGRLTCSIVAPHDHSLMVVGDEGVLTVGECWDYGAPVHVQPRTRLRTWAEKHAALRHLPGFRPKRHPLARPFRLTHRYEGAHVMDFARGVAELAAAIEERRPCRLSPEYALHVTEVVLAIQHPPAGGRTVIGSTFAPMAPMPWALP